jgi:hypothetical protein
VLRKYCVTGSAALVTSPDVPLTAPPAYVTGSISLHKTEPYVAWDLVYGSFGSVVTSIDVRGPLLATAPADGPVYVVLCETGTLSPCLFPSTHALKQKVTTTIDHTPLDDYVDTIAVHADKYKARSLSLSLLLVIANLWHTGLCQYGRWVAVHVAVVTLLKNVQ